ncbi:DUF6290 family protein [Ferrimicrobium acidiphilum]|uniref:Ribbon-helix-helix protein, copG family n=1 Tax=Ferrimicrobium acidiphilum DSM 19497 TaxID=1121877 RepID=A0A0D8FWV9_9ACTN|nr:DUF6290 family protein [Ferrimicrobium acidiphilum]KJE77651.1 ribbon-helix-helix protein, copG family [Ferrimicrobium acidiphilum DSM 19497]
MGDTLLGRSASLNRSSVAWKLREVGMAFYSWPDRRDRYQYPCYSDTMDTRTTTIRLPAPTAEALEVVAKADNQSVSEAVRQAVLEHIRTRRADPEFQKSLDHLLDSQREVFERLADL